MGHFPTRSRALPSFFGLVLELRAAPLGSAARALRLMELESTFSLWVWTGAAGLGSEFGLVALGGGPGSHLHFPEQTNKQRPGIHSTEREGGGWGN